MCVSPFRTGAERLHAAGTLRSLGPSGLFGFDLGGGRRTLAAEAIGSGSPSAVMVVS